MEVSPTLVDDTKDKQLICLEHFRRKPEVRLPKWIFQWTGKKEAAGEARKELADWHT